MNDLKQPEQAANAKLEWLEPTFEVLHDPDGAIGGGNEIYTTGPS